MAVGLGLGLPKSKNSSSRLVEAENGVGRQLLGSSLVGDSIGEELEGVFGGELEAVEEGRQEEG